MKAGYTKYDQAECPKSGRTNTKGSGTPEALRPPLPQIPEPHYWSWGLPADSIFPQRCLPLRPRRVGLWVSWGPPPTFAPRPFHCCASVMDHLPGASSRVRTLCAPGRAGTSRARLPQDPRLTPATRRPDPDPLPVPAVLTATKPEEEAMNTRITILSHAGTDRLPPRTRGWRGRGGKTRVRAAAAAAGQSDRVGEDRGDLTPSRRSADKSLEPPGRWPRKEGGGEEEGTGCGA